MGRKPFVAEKTMLRLREGTAARIDAVLEPTETRADFIRKSIEEQIARRERSKARKERD
jgi:hypothetical protein